MNCAKNEYSFLAQFSTNYKILTMKYFFCLVFFVTFVLACNTEQTYQTDYEVVNISEETLPPVKPLKLEKINVQEDYLMGAMCFVYHDTVLLVVKTYDPYPLTHMVTIVNMNTNTKIGEYITRGEGLMKYCQLYLILVITLWIFSVFILEKLYHSMLIPLWL